MIGEMPTKKRAKLKLLKLSGGSGCEVILLSEGVASLRVHWIGKRSYVCPGKECPACGDVESRWVGFFVVRVPVKAGSQAMLLEVSESAYDRFDALCRLEGLSCAGLLAVSITRRKIKSPLVIEPLAAVEAGRHRLVSRVEVYDALATIYGLPSIAPDEELSAWEERAAPVATRLIVSALARDSLIV